MPLLALSEITKESLMVDLAMQRSTRSQLQMQLMVVQEGLGLEFNPLQRRQPIERHLVGEFETLQTISTRLFGKPDYWEAIAKINNIQYPFTVYPGQVLKVPEVKRHG